MARATRGAAQARPVTGQLSDAPGVLQLLDAGGCVLCRTRDNAVAAWLRWFKLAQSDPATLAKLATGARFCPVHARWVLREGSAQLLRVPWESALSATIALAEGLVAGNAAAPPGACPICQTSAEREGAAADDLIASLRLPAVGAAMSARGGLCYVHLRRLAPRLGPEQAAIAAEAVAARLACLPPDTPETCLAVAGYDPDALARAPLLAAHLQILARSGDGGPDAADARDRLVADLSAGSCPLCRAVGRHQARYLFWAQECWPDRGLSSVQLCPAHLYDMWAIGPEAPILTSLHAAAAGCNAGRLGSLARAVAADPRAARRASAVSAAAAPVGIRQSAPPAGSARAGPRPVSVLEEYRIARAEVARDTYCRACRIGEWAERRALALIQACRDDASVTRAIEDAHGACLRHARAAQLGSAWPPDPTRPGASLQADVDPAWRPLLIRLATRLRQAKWELDEDAEKWIWHSGYQPSDAEQLAWRRIPALLDGRVYLGLSETEARAAELGATDESEATAPGSGHPGS